MKRIWWLFLIFLLSFIADAMAANVVVLTSLENPKNKPFWRSKDYQISQDIENRFHKVFKDSGFNLIFKHEANRVELAKFLNSPETIALFWVSHAGEEKEVIGMNLDSMIMDINGNNLKNVFQKIHPNLKFLGVVGCSAATIFEDFKKKGFIASSLKMKTFNKRVSLSSGIEDAINASAEVLDDEPESFNKSNSFDIEAESRFIRRTIVAKKEFEKIPNEKVQTLSGEKITIINTNSDMVAELRIDDVFIGNLQAKKLPQEFNLPKVLLKKRTKLIVDYDKKANVSELDLLPLMVQSDDVRFTFDYLKDQNQKPYGRKTNFYYLFFPQ